MRKRIVCFGDSNTWGYDAISDGRFGDEIRWTGVLGAELGEGYTVIEEGLCGRTTVFEDPLNEGLKGLDYLYPCLMSHSPLDYLIVMLGTNDVKERFSATPKNIADGMKRLIVKALHAPVWRATPKILVVSPPPIGLGCERSRVAGEMGVCSDKSKLLSAELKRCAQELDCHFYDASEAASMNQIDFMHLDQESHRILGIELKKMIENW